MHICHCEHEKWDKNKCHYRYTRIPFWGRSTIQRKNVIGSKEVAQATKNVSNNKKELHHFRYNELHRDIFTLNHKGLWTFEKTDITKENGTWNITCQNLYGRGKNSIKKDATMTFYYEK